MTATTPLDPLAALPLVIPSYVAAFCLLGFFGERGLLAGVDEDDLETTIRHLINGSRFTPGE